MWEADCFIYNRYICWREIMREIYQKQLSFIVKGWKIYAVLVLDNIAKQANANV